MVDCLSLSLISPSFPCQVLSRDLSAFDLLVDVWQHFVGGQANYIIPVYSVLDDPYRKVKWLFNDVFSTYSNGKYVLAQDRIKRKKQRSRQAWRGCSYRRHHEVQLGISKWAYQERRGQATSLALVCRTVVGYTPCSFFHRPMLWKGKQYLQSVAHLRPNVQYISTNILEALRTMQTRLSKPSPRVSRL